MTLQVDPRAALAVFPVGVMVAGEEFTIPPLPAAVWFAAVINVDQRPLPLIPGLLPAREHVAVMAHLFAGRATVRELVEVQRDVLEVASGWRWWMADRLIRSAGADWLAVGGAMLTRGVDFWRWPLGAVLAALYAMATEGLDAAGRARFLTELTAPPVGQVSPQELNRHAADMFAAALAEAQAGG